MGSDDASFVQGEKPPEGSSPVSAVLPVARKSSGTLSVASVARERLERVVLLLTEHAIAAYREAAQARANGDEPGRERLHEAANRAHALSVEALDELAGMPA